MISKEENLARDQGPGLIPQELCVAEFIKVSKGTENASGSTSGRGTETAPLLVSARGYIIFT